MYRWMEEDAGSRMVVVGGVGDVRVTSCDERSDERVTAGDEWG